MNDYSYFDSCSYDELTTCAQARLNMLREYNCIMLQEAISAFPRIAEYYSKLCDNTKYSLHEILNRRRFLRSTGLHNLVQTLYGHDEYGKLYIKNGAPPPVISGKEHLEFLTLKTINLTIRNDLAFLREIKRFHKSHKYPNLARSLRLKKTCLKCELMENLSKRHALRHNKQYIWRQEQYDVDLNGHYMLKAESKTEKIN